jgi:capsular exopolysaccharide synthesis family protein
LELRHYASILWRWLWLIVLGTGLAAGTSYWVSSTMPRLYEASSRLLVNQAQTPGIVAYSDVLTSQQLTKTYSELIHTRPVLENALANLKLEMTPEQLDGRLNVQVVRDTMLLSLKAQSTDPQQAADIANAVAQAFIEENRATQLGQAASSRDSLHEQLTSLEADIKSTSDQIDRLRNAPGLAPEARLAETSRLQGTLSQYQLTYSQLLKSEQDMRLAESKAYSSVVVAEPAKASIVPVSPKTAQNVLLAALVGLMLAVGVALLVEYLDDTVKSDDTVLATLGVPALGFVSRIHGGAAHGAAYPLSKNPHSPVVEAFRILRTNLQFSLLDRPGRALLVTSASPLEGKTTTVVSLAQVLADAGQRVIVVDADLRRPSVHRYFNLRNDQGLTTALMYPDLLDSALSRPAGAENLRVMTSGPIPPNPAELLGSPRMGVLLEKLQTMADIVLVDSPPALAVADPSILAHMVDGVVVVVDSGRTRAVALTRTREALERAAGAGKILGGVLNKLSVRAGRYGYYYQRYYGESHNGKNGNGHVKSAELTATGEPGPGSRGQGSGDKGSS